MLVCLTTGSILISDIRIAARLEHVRQKFRQEIPEDADDATMNAYCNLSWPTSWFLSRTTGWQNDRCVVWMGGAEGYSNQILSMLRAYELVRPRKLLLVPMATEHATEPECLNKAIVFSGRQRKMVRSQCFPSCICQHFSHFCWRGSERCSSCFSQNISAMP